MAYRDELEAAEVRISLLEDEVRDLKGQLVRVDKVDEVARTKTPTPPAVRRPFGRIYYQPPTTWIPFLHLYVAALKTAWVRRPSEPAREIDSVIAWLGHRILYRPLVYLLWLPLYAMAMCLLLPWAAVVSVALSVPYVPYALLSRLSFKQPGTESRGFKTGDVTVYHGGMFLFMLMACTMQPLMLICFRVMVTNEDGPPWH